MWQDVLFTVGGVLLTLLLIPTLHSPDAAVPRTTSVPTCLVIASFAPTFYTLGLHVSAAGNALTALGWAFIALRRAP